jgi:predicted sulfurtransferase
VAPCGRVNIALHWNTVYTHTLHCRSSALHCGWNVALYCVAGVRCRGVTASVRAQLCEKVRSTRVIVIDHGTDAAGSGKPWETYSRSQVRNQKSEVWSTALSRTSHVACRMSHVACRMSHVACRNASISPKHQLGLHLFFPAPGPALSDGPVCFAVARPGGRF